METPDQLTTVETRSPRGTDMPVSPFRRAVEIFESEVPSTPAVPAPKRGWATPEDVKEDLVDQMMRIVEDPDAKAKDRVAAFNALRVADQSQWERDHPVESGKSKGGGTSQVNINLNMAAAAALRGMIEAGTIGIIEELPAPDKSSAFGDGRQQREVEAGPAPANDQQHLSGSLEVSK